MQAIGPFWDGNEVWLLTGAGALFATFPLVYASVFSGFYLAMMLVLFGLILQAVAIKYRNKVDSPTWKARWDVLFFLGIFYPPCYLGLPLATLPLDYL
ncbi:MAG: cytochrome d ubiquinol oxidase subunit II [Carboxydocellales bacterium]